MGASPLLGLLVHPGSPAALPRLLARMAPWCEPHALDPATDQAAAWLATSPRARGLDLALRGGAPVGIWVSTVAELEELRGLGATAEEGAGGAARPGVVVLADDAALADRLGGGAVVVGNGGGPDGAVAVPPFVRARLRARHRLPDRLVVSFDPGGDQPVREELVPTALACAAAVAIVGDRLVEALAWGAPTVTDAASAAAVGARHGVEVLVGGPEELVALAGQVADDIDLAAALSRAGRRLVERRDVSGAAVAAADRLGLLEHVEPLARLEHRLAELRTPERARIRVRAGEMVAGVVQAREGPG